MPWLVEEGFQILAAMFGYQDSVLEGYGDGRSSSLQVLSDAFAPLCDEEHTVAGFLAQGEALAAWAGADGLRRLTCMMLFGAGFSTGMQVVLRANGYAWAMASMRAHWKQLLWQGLIF